ncbi:MAG: DNA translocase FtsK [Anaerobacillus sp.]|uniref:DNA translocase FtsK n=1 Tax=Anaerobacillus sp. TaxID=1872506 RepID=UPI00391CE9FB
MFNRLKTTYKKVHSFLFGQEEEHIHTRDERKQYYGRVKQETEAEARMIHQYPKHGKFRFPLAVDETDVVEPKRERSTNRKVNKIVPQRQTTAKQPINKLKLETKEEQSTPKVATTKIQERKKFQGVNFKARTIPSPIYAFDKPPETIRSELAEIEEVIESNNVQNDYFQFEEEFVSPNCKVTNEENDDLELVLYEAVDDEREEIDFSYDTTEVNSEKVNGEVVDRELFVAKVDSQSQEEEFESQFEAEDHSEIEMAQLEASTEVLLEEELTNNTHEDFVELEEYEEYEEVVEEITNDQDEVVATTEQDKLVDFSREEEMAEKREELEQLSAPLNTINYETPKVDGNEPRKTVVPFNVLMFHKDRVAQKKNEVKTPQVKSYQFPTLQLLNIPPRQPDNSHQWLEEKQEILEQTLANFNVLAKVVGVTKGPSVTRFEIQPDPGVKVSKVTGLTDDIKLSLAAKDIRMEAPIPGKNAIGIEVPNDVSVPVVIREILRSNEFLKDPSPLTVALGLDIEGKPIVTDLQKMPHGLIAGATGSGKSVCINSILISIMFKATPDEVKLLLVDPKMVELAPYNDIPHLVTPVITDAKQATIALKWAVEEMDRRYELFVQNGVRDIKRYNEVMKTDNDPNPAMPFIVIIIDELADLMMVSPHDVEEAICRIAQKARACGIHLLLATQRPSVDVITGLIKANIPTRIAFSVSSQADSRTIIDSGGAERLLGKGDMLLFENGASKPVRVQGNYVSDEEIDRVIALVKEQRKPNYLFDKEHLIKTFEAGSDQEDDLFEEACYYVLEQGGASSSSLQRRFRIGFNRAARLIDMMEARGIISEAMGSKPRNVLVSEEELSDRM